MMKCETCNGTGVIRHEFDVDNGASWDYEEEPCGDCNGTGEVADD